MKYVISAGTKKRELETPFQICGTPNDLMNLSEKLAAAARAMKGLGWVTICDDRDLLIINTPPSPRKEIGCAATAG